MCLSIPSKVVEIDDDNIATVDTMGVTRQVSLDLMSDPVEIGEYVLIHVGYAMNKIDEADALESLKVYREILEIMDAEEQQRVMEEDEKVNAEGRETPLGDNCPQRGDA